MPCFFFLRRRLGSPTACRFSLNFAVSRSRALGEGRTPWCRISRLCDHRCVTQLLSALKDLRAGAFNVPQPSSSPEIPPYLNYLPGIGSNVKTTRSCFSGRVIFFLVGDKPRHSHVARDDGAVSCWYIVYRVQRSQPWSVCVPGLFARAALSVVT